VRIAVFILLVFLATILGGIYGSLYDQITYSVNSEFFTKMRFPQNGFENVTHERWVTAQIGFINTWRVGCILGICLALAGLLHTTNKKMFWVTLQSFAITIFTGFLFGMIALLFAQPAVDIDNEINVIDKLAFNKVLSMNNYSYVGGIIGMFLGLAWQVINTRGKRKPIETEI
jgi:MFS family permease